MEIDTFISILSVLAPPNFVDFYNWLTSPLLAVWFKAVSRRPSAFAAPFLPWETCHAAVAPTEASPLLSQVRHLQWAQADHLLVDHILTAAKSSAMYEKFSLHFQHCLADFNSSADSSHLLLGPADDIFSATHVLTCRLPSTSSWATNCHFDTFLGAPTDTLPDFVRHIEAVVVNLDPDRPPVPLGSVAPGGASTIIASPPRKTDASTVGSLFGGSRAFRNANAPPPKPPRPTDGSAKHKAPSIVTILSTQSVASPPTKKKGAYFDRFLHLSLPLTAVTTKWFTPVERAAATPLPSTTHSSGSMGPALRTAAHLAKHSSKPKPASLTVDKSPHFSLVALLDAGHKTGSLMRRYATWGSYRLEEDADIIHSASGTPFSADCKLAPGVISLECAQALLPMLGKPATSTQVKAFLCWAKDQVQEIHTKSKPGPPCHFHSNFWCANNVQALLSLSFCSGVFLESKDDLSVGHLFPVSFLLSIGEHADLGVPKIPSDGIAPQHLCQHLLNVVFILHLPGRDSKLHP